MDVRSTIGTEYFAENLVPEVKRIHSSRKELDRLDCLEPKPVSPQSSGGAESFDAKRQIEDWKIDKLAHALAKGRLEDVKIELRDSIRRIPYHGLWAGACTTKPQHAVLMGQLGQDIVRSLNGVLGQYVTAEKYGAQLRRAFQKSCALAKLQEVRVEILSQEYNMVFLRADRCPTAEQAKKIQGILSREVWSSTIAFLNRSEMDYIDRREALIKIRDSLDETSPLLTLGICEVSSHGALSKLERLARSAIAACAASKIARCRPEGFAFVESNDIIASVEKYFSLLELNRDRKIGGQGMVVQSVSGRAMLNPTVLAEHRSKRLSETESSLVASAVSLLNCLDWVQQSRFTRLTELHRDAMVGRHIMRALGGKKHSHTLAGVKEFCRLYVPYLGIAEQTILTGGTLFWVDMKKLAVRCHIIREEKAAELLQKHTTDSALSVSAIVDTMIEIDLRVQDARDVLPQAVSLAGEFLREKKVSHQIQFHFGGDDAAFLVTTRGSALERQTAQGLGRYVTERCSLIRLAHCRVQQGANLAEEVCRLDRILTATKLD